jgi:hypothetical protein
MNKQQTALEYLVNQLFPKALSEEQYYHIEQAKEMEKEQIENAFEESRLTYPMIGFKHQTFEQYYSETYGGNK